MSGIITNTEVKSTSLKEKFHPYLGVKKIRFSLQDQSQMEGNIMEIGEDYIVVLVGHEVERIVLTASVSWLQVLE